MNKRIIKKVLLWLVLTLFVCETYLIIAWGQVDSSRIQDLKEKAEYYSQENIEIKAKMDEFIAANERLAADNKELMAANEGLAKACRQYCPEGSVSRTMPKK